MARIFDDGPPQKRRELVVRTLETVQMRAIDWLWKSWIPKGYITIWAGETGAGKSTVLADVAARVTTGSPWPGEPAMIKRSPGRVLWLGSEDGMEEMTVPRLIASGADLANIAEIEGVRQGARRDSFSMQDDLLAVLEELKRARDLGQPFSMLVIDPITSYLPGQRLRKVDLNDAGQLRSIIEPWLKAANVFGIAIVCVTHFSKDTTRSMVHRVIGSSAFAQTCRSLCTISSRPNDGPYSKALLQAKSNLPDAPGGAWRFRTEKVEVGTDPVTWTPIFATRPVWEHLDPNLTMESLMGGARGPVSQYPAVFGAWLQTFFSGPSRNERKTVSQVKAAAIEAGVATARWWDDHSSAYLDKENLAGVWWCRPKT